MDKKSANRVATLVIQGRHRLARIDVRHVVETVLGDYGVQKATRFISPKLIVRATRQHRPDRRTERTTIMLTVGAPNARERDFVRACVKAGEPFPVKKLQIRFYR